MPPIVLDKLIARVEDLPALPEVVDEVIRLTESPDSTPQDLNRVISRDQSLTARVLRLANSAYYGFARRISTVTDAVILLGFNTVRNLVMAASVHRVLDREVPGYELARGELWQHSLTAAMTARLLARQARYRQHEQAFVAGLLHDIGKVVLSYYVAEAYQELLRRVNEDGVPFMQAEAEIFGFDHAEVGSLVAKKWNLPEELVEAIANHHQPQEAKVNPRLTAITHLADAGALMLGLGVGADGLMYPVHEECLATLGLEPHQVEGVLSQVSESLADSDALWGE